MKLKRVLAIALVLGVLTGLLMPASAQNNEIATIIFTQELDNLNPMYTDMWFSGITTDLWLQPLITFDDGLNPVPALAAEIPSGENGGISEDGTTITYTLRDDLIWSDGETLDSSDYMFTYNMIMDENNTPNSRFPYDTVVTSVEAPDATTVVVTFDAPYAPWITDLFTFVLPEHVLAPVFDDEGTIDDAAWNRAPEVGVGPFVFQEWESGSHILLARNENYHGMSANLDGVFIRFVEDDAAQVAALLSGEGDIGTFISYSDLPQFEEAGIQPQVAASGYNEAWFFNVNPETAHPAMTDVNVRRAIQHAFNRQEIVDTLLLGGTYLPGTFWEGTPFDNTDIEAPTFDPELAAQLLDEAGWVDSDDDGVRDKDGVALELRYLTPPRQVRMDTQVIAQQDLAEVGISLILENPGYDIFWNSYGSGGPLALGEYDIAQYSTTGSFPDPNTSQFLCSEIPGDDNPEGGNDLSYCNPELDALFAAQTQTVDFAARQAIFREIAVIMDDAAIWTGVWYDPDVWVVNSRVQNVQISGATPFWNSAEWDIE